MKKVFLSIIILFITDAIIAQSATKSYAFRLKPRDDLKKEIDAFINQHHLKAAAIVTCVGSLIDAIIRFANQTDGTLLHGHFEIVSLTGVLSINGLHLHLSISDEKGNTIGGHLLEGC